MLLSIVKSIFVIDKDYTGRKIDHVIERLAAQHQTPIHVWSYIKETHVYENTVSGMRVYPHETRRIA
jgi:hypothetical protein